MTREPPVHAHHTCRPRRHRPRRREKLYGIGFGITSFFIKASIAAMRTVWQLNVKIRGDEIVFKRY